MHRHFRRLSSWRPRGAPIARLGIALAFRTAMAYPGCCEAAFSWSSACLITSCKGGERPAGLGGAGSGAMSLPHVHHSLCRGSASC